MCMQMMKEYALKVSERILELGICNRAEKVPNREAVLVIDEKPHTRQICRPINRFYEMRYLT
ncbi:hypothetical protein M422DRAFT_39452, partial [Sphaerobolus stellatus SS14]